MANFEQMPLKNCLAVTQQVTVLYIACLFYVKPSGWISGGSRCTNTYNIWVHSCKLIPFSIFFLFLHNCTFFYWPGCATGFFCQLHKRDKVELGMGSNEQLLLQCYIWTGSGVGKPSGDNGGFWEVQSPLKPLFDWVSWHWAPVLGWLWSGSCGFREGVRTLLCADLSQTQVGWSGRGWRRRRRRRGAAGEAYCGALWM